MKIFISHSSKDRKLALMLVDLLINGVKIDNKDIFCTSTHDSLKIGEDFTIQIKNNLKKAQVILLLITQNFFDSKFCIMEMGAAWCFKENIIPIIISPLDVDSLKDTPLKTTQILKLDSVKKVFKQLYTNVLVNEKIIKRLSYEQETCLYEKIQAFLDDVNKYVEENIYKGIDAEKVDISNKEVSNEKADTSNKEVSNEKADTSNKEVSNEKVDTSNKKVSNEKVDTSNKKVSSEKADTSNKKVSSEKADTSNKEVSSEKADTSNKEVSNENTNTYKKEVIPLTVGKFTFDYTKNNGVFIIGTGDYSFSTKWSQSSNLSINAYKYSWDIVSLARVRCDLNLFFAENQELDFSSIIRTPKIGDTVVWKNINDNFATTKIIDIKDVESGDDVYELTCEYTIYEHSHFFV